MKKLNYDSYKKVHFNILLTGNCTQATNKVLTDWNNRTIAADKFKQLAHAFSEVGASSDYNESKYWCLF